MGAGARIVFLGIFASALAGEAGAAETVQDRVAFSASDLGAGQAQTALDLIERLPGFTFDEGDDEVRGYAGGAGNVLVDGRRPASKYDGLEAVLKRIPAASVDHIELIRGGSGVDMQGRAVVANVVRRKTAALEGRGEAGVFLHGDGRFIPDLTIEGARRGGERLFEASLSLTGEADDESGDGHERRVAPDGRLEGFADSQYRATDTLARATLGYEQPAWGGRLRINGTASGLRTIEEELTRARPTGLSVIDGREDEVEGEVGVRFARGLGRGGELEILAIQQLRRSEETEAQVEGAYTESFEEDSVSGETILRGVARFRLSPALEIEGGGEAAFNFLDSRVSAAENGAPTPLPASKVRVEERRAEAFVRSNWKVGPYLVLEVGGALEVSEISQSGDAALTRVFVYPKPRAAVFWSPTAADQLRLRVEREVGQLDFGDYVSSAEFSTGTIDAGNADLEPYTAWVIEAAWERRLWKGAAAVVTLRHWAISDVVDAVAIPADPDRDGVDEIFEGPGNIGQGVRDEVVLGLTLPTERFGAAGGLLKADVTYRRSRVTDPRTGLRRPIIGDKQPLEGAVAFTQDLPVRRLRWGAELSLGEREFDYRLDEARIEGARAEFSAFVEYFPARAWSVRIDAENLSGRRSYLIRDRYTGPRDAAILEAVETRSRAFAPYLRLRFRRTLG